jgi:hypothetical protein
MPHSKLSPTTQRLVACLESFSHQEDGAMGHEDWHGLVNILERELALLQRLAQEKPADAAALKPHTEKLQQRFDKMALRIAAAQARDSEELAQLGETTKRIHGVRNTYLKA